VCSSDLYVPPPPPAAYTPAPKPLDHRAKRSTEKAIADPAPIPEIQATGRLTFAVARTTQNTEHRRLIAASEPAGGDTRSSVVTLLLAIGLGCALLALLLPLARPMLPGQLGVLVHERRDSFIVGAGVCVVGIALGVMVASMGS